MQYQKLESIRDFNVSDQGSGDLGFAETNLLRKYIFDIEREADEGQRDKGP